MAAFFRSVGNFESHFDHTVTHRIHGIVMYIYHKNPPNVGKWIISAKCEIYHTWIRWVRFFFKGFLGCKRSVEGLQPWVVSASALDVRRMVRFILRLPFTQIYDIYQEQYVHNSSPIEDLAKFLPVNKNSARVHLCLNFFASCILSVIGSTCTLI